MSMPCGIIRSKPCLNFISFLRYTINIRTRNLTNGGICFLSFQLVSEDIFDSDNHCGNIIKNKILSQTRKSLHRGRRERK